MSEFEVHDEVQLIDYDDDSIKDGVVTVVCPASRPKPERSWSTEEQAKKSEWIPSITIKWEDGTESTHLEDEIEVRDSEVERQFRLTVNEIGTKIQDKLSKAAKLINEAEELAEEHGVPFNSGVSPLGQCYIPGSLGSLFSELDKEFAYNLTETYKEYGNEGWAHSAVC
jgi:hypothetical protein